MTWSALLYSLPPALTAIFLAVLAAVPLLRERPLPANRLFMLLCLSGCMLNLDILIQLNAPSAAVALQSSRIGYIVHPFVLPFFIHFFHAYLKIRRQWLVLSAYGYAAALSLCSQSSLMISGMQYYAFGYSGRGGLLYPFMALGAAVITIYNMVILYRAIGRERQSIQKNKLKYIFAGFVALGVLTCLNVLPRFGLPVYPPGNFGFIPLAVFAIGLFRHDLLDIGAVIRKGLLYSILTGLLTGIYSLVIIAAQKVFARTWLEESMAFTIAMYGLIALVFGLVRNRIQKIIDHLFARGRFDYQLTLKHASRRIASALDYDAITRLLRETIVDAMQVAHCILFLQDRHHPRYQAVAAVGEAVSGLRDLKVSFDEPPVDSLLKSKKALIRSRLLAKACQEGIQGQLAVMSALKAELVLPMMFRDRLNGFLVLGEKRSGVIYSAEDLNLLEILCMSSALAIENTRAYQALKNLNRTLEIKVDERTRDLQLALKEKERTQEQLIRSESLASLGQLVAGAAHELNNPLASVTSLLQSAVEELEGWKAGQLPDEDLIDDLKFAGKDLARARSIVASLLGLARQNQTYEEAVDFAAVAKDALRVLHNQYKDTGIKIAEDFGRGLPRVQGNFAHLGQVALNVIKNALQAVDPATGRIFLSTRWAAEDSQLVFACHDNGPGAPAAIRRDVFKPFFTTKPVGQGTGLGLYICHEIIRKHGGTIELESARDRGTVVKVCLPVDRKAPPFTGLHLARN